MQGPPDILRFGLPPIPTFLWPAKDISCTVVLSCFQKTTCQREPLFCDRNSTYEEMWKCLFPGDVNRNHLLSTPSGLRRIMEDNGSLLSALSSAYQNESATIIPNTSTPIADSRKAIYVAAAFVSLFLVLVAAIVVVFVVRHKRFRRVLPVADPAARAGCVNYLSNENVKGKLWRMRRPAASVSAIGRGGASLMDEKRDQAKMASVAGKKQQLPPIDFHQEQSKRHKRKKKKVPKLRPAQSEDLTGGDSLPSPAVTGSTVNMASHMEDG
ncbi:PREDICTED: uncharacterized protein LOC106816598 [Priapulus caudatus]|uniref:Uncharacterized protein LOC106816598 n=1 Tax=Priapulus caudatus TaxID=37621 RepID=A0ABM1EWY6_PRICU|nr:PREDICTED: uncharacterized protein LOC106816598 [Priapulus caudatus]XP_014676716.1 PREDICTED: uncharacterized protein LOC106816598 [Priapulus caudatus]